MRESIRRVLRSKETRGNEWAQEWDDVEVAERLETLEAQVARLQAERDQLRAELTVATRGEGQAGTDPAGGMAAPFAGDQTVQPRRDDVAWWNLALLTLLIVAPWAVIACIVWLIAG
jgi:hypothetical protein